MRLVDHGVDEDEDAVVADIVGVVAVFIRLTDESNQLEPELSCPEFVVEFKLAFVLLLVVVVVFMLL